MNAKIDQHHKKLLHNNDCETPYIEIYIDLQLINFNLLPILLNYAYHYSYSNMVVKYIVLSKIFSVVSDNILCICAPLDFKKVHSSSSYFIFILNSLLIRYEIYLPDPRECLDTT